MKVGENMKDARLHTKDIINQQIVFGEINLLIYRFENNVYFKGLKGIIDKSKIKGMSGEFGEVELMSWTMAGSIMFTFRKGDADLTFICAENEIPSRMGLQSINATYKDAEIMVEEVIREWNSTKIPIEERFKDDKKVMII